MLVLEQLSKTYPNGVQALARFSTAISTTFDVSKMPSQRMNNGIQAIDGMARKACSVGSSSRNIVIE